MPNWCMNTLYLTHSDPEQIERAEDALGRRGFMNEFLPTPPDVDSYTWHIEKWGTKWEPTEWQNIEPMPFIEDSAYFLSATFDTAWAPPIGFYDTMNTTHNIRVNAMFYEGGEEVFGKCVYDENTEKNIYYNYPRNERQLSEIRKEIDEKLDSFMSCEWDRLLEMWAEKSDQDSIF